METRKVEVTVEFEVPADYTVEQVKKLGNAVADGKLNRFSKGKGIRVTGMWVNEANEVGSDDQ